MSASKKKYRKIPAKDRSANWLWVGIGALLIAALGTAALWISNGGPQATQDHSGEISVEEAYTKSQAGAFLLDVREPNEWKQYHVPGSTLISLGDLKSRLSEVPRDQEIVVVCRSGNRSKTGRNILQEAGFSDVVSMAGGLKEWRTAGYPTVSGE